MPLCEGRGADNMTGIGLKFAELVLAFAGNSLALSHVMVMLAGLVLGMDVPSDAAYLIIAIVLGPALQGLGVTVTRPTCSSSTSA